MNKILIMIVAVCLYLSTAVHAQTEVLLPANGRNFQQITDSLFQKLDKSRIPSGVLTDRVYLGSYIKDIANNDTISATKITQLFKDLEAATLPVVGFVPRFGTVKNNNYLASIKNKLPIIVVNYNASQIKEDALPSGALAIGQDSFVKDNNFSLNPYTTFNVRTGGITVDEVYASVPYVLTLPLDNILRNNANMATVSKVVVTDLSANISYEILPGSTRAITFSDTGRRYLGIKIHFIDGGITDVTFPIYVLPEIRTFGAVDCGIKHRLLQSRIPFQGEGESEATTTWIDYHVYHRYESGSTVSCEPKMKKPIIILDGFDPQNTRNYTEMERDFFRSQSDNKLVEELRRKGFDVILVNFPVLGQLINTGGGTSDTVPSIVKKLVGSTLIDIDKDGRDGGADYIERNAFALVALIQDLSALLTTNGVAEANKELVIVGPSMGGLISRYALAYMEKQHSLGTSNMKHYVRNWISFDAPHDGGNIALAHQKSFDFFGNTVGIEDAKDALDNKLLSKAAKQILIEQLDGQNNTAPLRSAFYNRLQTNGLVGSNGFPQNTRKVAMINGSGNGTNFHAPGTQLIDSWGKKIGIKVFKNNVWAMPAYGTTNALYEVRGVVLSGSWWPLSFRFSIHNSNGDVTNINPRGSMDIVPGGNYNVQNEVSTAFRPALIAKGIRDQSWAINAGMSFIPTISSLAFKNNNFNWSTRVDDRDLVCENEIYFDNYLFAPVNEQHIADPDNSIYISDAKVAWVMEEIQYGKAGCPTICATKIVQTTGDTILCANTPVTYSLDVSVPAGSEVTWVLPAGIILHGTPTDDNIRVVKWNGVNEASIGMKFIKVIITPKTGGTQCGASKVLTKEIKYGGFEFSDTKWTFDEASPIFTVTINPNLAGYTYEWQEHGSSVWTSTGTHNFQTFNKIPMAYYPGTVKWYQARVSAASCPLDEPIAFLSDTYLYGGWSALRPGGDEEGTISSMILTPNPTTSNWDLTLSQEWSGQTVNIQVISVDGKVLTNFNKVANSAISIDGSKLAAGVYFIQVKSAKMSHNIKAVKQ